MAHENAKPNNRLRGTPNCSKGEQREDHAKVDRNGSLVGSYATPIITNDYIKHSTLAFYLLLGASTVLFLFGVLMVFSASSIELIESGSSAGEKLLKQGGAGVVGFILMIFVSKIGIKNLERLMTLALYVSIPVLVAVPFLGRTINGNTNWINIGPVSVQPSEFVKLALITWLGFQLARNYKDGRIREIKAVFNLRVLGVLGLVFAAVIIGGDLGTAIVFGAMVMGQMIIAGVPKRIIAGISFFAFLGAALLVIGSDSRRDRILSVFSKCEDPQGVCYQPLHGLDAYISGGIFGVGPGASREKWSYLPESSTDFILSIIGEEFGLIGSLIVISLFLVIIVSMYIIMTRSVDVRAKIITGGVFCWISSQAMMNIGATLKLFPVIGVPLPLVSYGMSSLLSTFIGIGVVLSFARIKHILPDYEDAPRSVRAKGVITTVKASS